jgi:hypothetical protein
VREAEDIIELEAGNDEDAELRRRPVHAQARRDRTCMERWTCSSPIP